MAIEKRPTEPERVREMVEKGYTRVAKEAGADTAAFAETWSRGVGYSDDQLAAVPEGANLGVGCGNPTAIDSLKPGEVVVDLGSGAGMDAFLAARAVGPEGRVIGIDMTDAMIDKARENAAKNGVENVEFRKGRIEELPLEDESVDVIISNCVINLSPEKDKVYAEAYRVLKPGGRIMVSDLVLEHELPEAVLESIEAYIGCVGGASLRSVYLRTVEEAGFPEVRVDKASKFGDSIALDDPTVKEAMDRFGITIEQVEDALEAVTSLHVFARKAPSI
jgi:arsenite methyltransferase